MKAAGAYAIADAANTGALSQLVELRIGFNLLGDKGCAGLVGALHSKAHLLEYLDLRDNGLPHWGQGLQCIAQMLRESSGKLRTLRLCRSSDSGLTRDNDMLH